MSNRSEDDTSDPGEVAVASFLSEEKEAAGKVPLKSEQTDSSTESNHHHSDSSFAERKRRRYYAVREGCAMTVASVAVGVKIRSAIFLNWEDARQFVDALQSFPHEAEYAVFDSVDEAEDYLVEGEVEMRALNELNLSVGEAVAAGVADASFDCNSSGIMPSIPPVNMNMKPTILISTARKRKRASVEKNKQLLNLKKYDEWGQFDPDIEYLESNFKTIIDQNIAAKCAKNPKFRSRVPTQEEYNYIYDMLRNWKFGDKRPPKDRRYHEKYVLGIGSQNNLVCRRNTDNTPGAKVATIEGLFDIIYQCHKELGHPLDPRSTHNKIKSEWYGVAEEFISVLIEICPICLAKRKKISGKQRRPKMILPKTIEKRVEGLIEGGGLTAI